MRLRKRLLVATTFVVSALSAGAAFAAPPSPAGQPKQSSSQFSLRRDEAGGADASVARQRARAGDCAGALPAFDNAINLTIEPTLRRDRGLCHEKLGHPFPAIDDYRAYLVAKPDAPDADQIRDRLARLEEANGTKTAESFRESDESLHAGGSFALGTQGGKTSGDSGSSASPAREKREAKQEKVLGPKSGEKERSYDYYASQERIADAAENSPLRFGTGWAIGPFLQVPRYFFAKGNTSEAGFAVGASIRYAWSPSLTFLIEGGYVGFGTTGDIGKLGGPLAFVGIEYRIPLNTYASDQLFLGIGPGFEHYENARTKLGLNVINVRGRFGYRHVFGPAVGLELGVDGGPGYAFASGDAAGSSGNSESLTLISGAAALIIGF
jgi:hypothetical protein